MAICHVAIAAASNQLTLPIWGVVAVWLYVLFRMIRNARQEERRRRLENQPHTFRDSALLLVSALAVVGTLACAALIEPLHSLTSPEIEIAAIMAIVGGSLTYVFNRKRIHRRR